MPGMALIQSFALVGIEAVAVTLAVDSAVWFVGGFHDAAYTLLERLLRLCGSTLATARRDSRAISAGPITCESALRTASRPGGVAGIKQLIADAERLTVKAPDDEILFRATA